MYRYIKSEVRDWKDDDELVSCLNRIVNKETGDGSGLIYGIGHAIYTLSDPRAVVLKQVAKSLAAKKGYLEEFELYESVERLGPAVLREFRNEPDKALCANVDMYSGLVYRMLEIPEELFTPLFAVARMVGWCAHRIEEVYNPNKIIRPAYKVIAPIHDYVPLDERI